MEVLSKDWRFRLRFTDRLKPIAGIPGRYVFRSGPPDPLGQSQWRPI